MAFILTKSITPANSSSAPIARCIGTALAPKRSFNCSTTDRKFAPALSILLTNTIRGTEYFSIWRQTVSVCGCTPDEPHSTKTAPSSTRKERSTSMVKSTCPGVSIILIR